MEGESVTGQPTDPQELPTCPNCNITFNTNECPRCGWMNYLWAVEAGFETSTFIPHTGGETYRILWYPDGRVAFEHKCKVIDGQRVICAPRLQIGQGHEVITRDPLHIEASILCPDCGTHGWIRNGRWVEA
jgi:hypothetical protein